jgi:hypothetical protein
MARDIAMVVKVLEKRLFRTTLRGKDAVGLMCGAIVAHPPVNPIAVAKCLTVWGSLVTVEEDVGAKNAFLEAMRRVAPNPAWWEAPD